MLQTFDDISMQKNLKNCWISSKDIDDQIILQSDWMKGTTDNTQPKNIV